MKLLSGQYYPRIGPVGWPYDESPYHQQILSAKRQLHLLCNDLNEIFTFIEPTKSNQNVYSHRLRNILLVASTEFEAQCVGILQANNALPQGAFFNTKDYVRLLPVFQLDQYHVVLRMFAGYPTLKPFAGWSQANPTTSLSWYDAYNKTKHNREVNFHFATLENVILSVAACFCLIYGQVYNGNYLNYSDDLFKLLRAPDMQGDGMFIQCYGDTFEAVDYPFV